MFFYFIRGYGILLDIPGLSGFFVQFLVIFEDAAAFSVNLNSVVI